MNSELRKELLESIKTGDFDAEEWILEGIIPAGYAELAYIIEEELDHLVTAERSTFSSSDWADWLSSIVDRYKHD